MSAPRMRLFSLGLVLAFALVGLSSRHDPHARGPEDSSDSGVAVAPPPRAAPLRTPLSEGAIRRFGDGRFQHPGSVTDLTFAAGGGWLIGCGSHGGASIWDARTGRVVRRLGGGDGADYRRVGLTPDNRILSVVAVLELPRAGDGPWQSIVSVRRYDVLSGREVARFSFPELGGAWPIHAAFSPDGTAVFVGSSTLVKYDLATGRALWQHKSNPQAAFKSIAAAPDGRVVAVSSGTAGGPVLLLDAATGETLPSLHGIEGGPGAVGFSDNGKFLATTTAARNKGVVVFSRNPLTFQSVLKVHSDSSYTPVLSPDGTVAAVWGWLDPPPRPAPTNEQELWQAAISRRLPPVTELHLFDTATGAHRCALGRPMFGRRFVSGDPPVAFSPDGSLVAMGGGEVSLWDSNTGSQSPLSPELTGGFGWRFSPHFSADERQLIYTEVEGDDVVTRDMIAGRETRRESKAGTNPWVYGGFLVSPPLRSADGQLTASSRFHQWGGDGVIFIFDESSDWEVTRIPTIGEREEAVAFSWDGKQLCTDDGNTVRVYDIATQKPVLDLGPGRVWCPVSSDGRYLAVIDKKDQHGPRTVTILSTSTWQNVRGISVDRDDTFVWSGGGRFTLRTEESFFRYPGGPVHRVAEWDVVVGCVSARQVELPGRGYRTVSPNGRMLAAWGEVEEGGAYPIRIYEVESGRERYRFTCSDPCQFAHFSPGGRYLLGHHPGIPYLLWDVRGARPASQPLDEAALLRAWADLASDDAATAFRAIRLLADHPGQAVALLRSKLLPVEPPDPVVVAQLIARLGANDFREREAAGKELERLGKPVGSALREAVRSVGSPEVVRRAAELIRRIGSKRPGIQLVPVRAVEAVEWMDTPESVRLLEAWASGAEGERLTEEAKAALHRRPK